MDRISLTFFSGEFRNKKFIAEATSLAGEVSDIEDRDLMLQTIAVAAAAEGNLKEAMPVIDRIQAPYERADGLRRVACLLRGTDDESMSKELLKRAAREADRIDLMWQRAEVLLEIGRGFVTLGELGPALDVWEQAVAIAKIGEDKGGPQDSLDSSSVLRELAVSLSDAKQQERALQVARGIRNSGKRESAVREVMTRRPPEDSGA